MTIDHVYHNVSKSSPTLVDINDKDIVIQIQRHGYSFLGFDSYDQFKVWYRARNVYLPCFEMIRNGPQKFRLDIDNKAPLDPSDLKEIACSVRAFLKHSCTIAVCGNAKADGRLIGIGYHIIADMAFDSSESVMHAVLDYIGSYGSKWKDCFDTCVYKKNQAFRLLGCSKKFKQEFKRVLFLYTDRIIDVPHECDVLALTMCSYARCHVPAEVRKYRSRTVREHKSLGRFCSNDRFHSPTTIRRNPTVLGNSWVTLGYVSQQWIASEKYSRTSRTFSLVCAKGINVEGIFSVREVKDRMIVLDSHSAYYCPKCLRIHTSENPYLLTGKDGYEFFCRREKKIF